MCTLSLVRATGGCRIVFNRDEQRDRPPSSDLVIRRSALRAIAMPVDPVSDGTWIGASDVGLIACLLNANPAPRAHSPAWLGRTSRGVIVPRLLSASTMDDALHQACDLNPLHFAPFTLLLVMHDQWTILSSDGARSTRAAPTSLDEPLVLSSSSLGDDLVKARRADLFSALLRKHPAASAAQDEFHAHQWADQPHLSVRMSRADARTVSRTTIETAPDSILLVHERFPEDSDMTQRSSVTLAITAQAASA